MEPDLREEIIRTIDDRSESGEIIGYMIIVVRGPSENEAGQVVHRSVGSASKTAVAGMALLTGAIHELQRFVRL